MAEIHRRLAEMERWPKSVQLQPLIRQGRSLLCEGLRDGPPAAYRLAQDQAWQQEVDTLDEVWQSMPTVRLRLLEPLEGALIREPTAQRQGLLNEQLIEARQQVDLAAEAFGQRHLDRAFEAEAKAAALVDTAGRLITFMERATAPELQALTRLRERERATGTSTLTRDFLARTWLPTDDARLRQHLGSTGRESVVSADSRSDARSAFPPLETVHRDSLARTLKELRAQADLLPQKDLLRASVKAFCSALRTEVQTGPRQVSPAHRELYEALRNQMALIQQAQLRVDMLALEQTRLLAAMPQLPPAQGYRRTESERLLQEMKGALAREDYGKVFQLGAHCDALQRATLFLARDRPEDVTLLLNQIAERRCELASQLRPWSNLRGLTSPALLYASQAGTLLRLLDESTHLNHCQSLLYELEAARDALTHLSDRRGWGQGPAAVAGDERRSDGGSRDGSASQGRVGLGAGFMLGVSESAAVAEQSHRPRD